MIAKKVPVTIHTYHITEIDEDEITTILTALRRMMHRDAPYGRVSMPTTADRMKAREVFGKLDEMHRSVPSTDLVDLIEGPDADEDDQ